MHPALSHLSTDKKLRQVLNGVGLRQPRRDDDIYKVLLRSIVGQQLSTKAAATIWGRFVDLLEDDFCAERVLTCDVEALRAVGLSYQKAGYVQNIARFSQEHDLGPDHMHSLSDPQALEYLKSIKGVGKWTAEMILMFAMGREDVFPVDDLGIRKAMLKLYDVESTGKQLISDLEAIADKWRPYRSYACLLLWDWLDGL